MPASVAAMLAGVRADSSIFYYLDETDRFAISISRVTMLMRDKNCAVGMLMLTTDKHEASRGLSAIAELVVFSAAVPDIRLRFLHACLRANAFSFVCFMFCARCLLLLFISKRARRPLGHIVVTSRQ